MAKRKPKTFSEQLRQLIETCGESRYRISQETGIHESQLSRFMHGTGRLTNETIDVLAEYLGVELAAKGDS